MIQVRHTDLRDFGEGKHKRVDDRPYGGGAGMVLMPGPVTSALRKVKKEGSYTIYLSPQGKKLDAKLAKELSQKEHLVLLCGHYEGIDERAIAKEVDEEISIGDYVLTSGCLPAIVLIDAVSRFVPGFLGHEMGAEWESFQEGQLEGPCYTRPEVFEEMEVPEVLKKGNHQEIKKWRQMMGAEKTRRNRPDLMVR